MAFPTDDGNTLTNVTDNVDYPKAADINNLNGDVGGLKTKVGIDDSAVATTLDYKLKNTTGGHNHDGSNSRLVAASSLPSAIDAIKIADGSVTNTEFQYINTLSSNAQTQIGTKAPLASPTFTGTVTLPVGLTGVVRTDAGVVSVDSDVTDIVSASSNILAGKVELATTAETATGTDATRAVTPDGLHDMTTLAGAGWFLDTDAMTEDSATKTASQQSIKAYVNAQITSAVATAKSALFPIGSLYANYSNSTNPGTLLGFGTWVAAGVGRTIVGIDATQTEFDTAGETGGAKTHTLITAEMPAHTHTQTFTTNSGTIGAGAGIGDNAVANTGSTGGGTAHNNLQPYEVYYLWRRTA